ncbi:MAG: hypothetical protein V7727_21040 [Sneathiella sp.]
MIFKFLFITGMIATLTACNSATETAEPVKVNSKLHDTISNVFYHQLMAVAGIGKITDRSNSLEIDVGDSNVYTNGSLIQRYKALAMCLSWDITKKETEKKSETSETKTTTKTVNSQLFVKPKAIEFGNGPDWNDVGFIALRGCEEQQLQKDLECHCQLVDRDDTNVLEVPDNIIRQMIPPNAKITSSQ